MDDEGLEEDPNSELMHTLEVKQEGGVNGC